MRKQSLPNQLKRPRELAHALGVGNSTILEYCREGLIRTVRVGKLYRIPQEEYDRILREGIQRREATP